MQPDLVWRTLCTAAHRNDGPRLSLLLLSGEGGGRALELPLVNMKQVKVSKNDPCEFTNQTHEHTSHATCHPLAQEWDLKCLTFNKQHVGRKRACGRSEPQGVLQVPGQGDVSFQCPPDGY